MTKELQSIKDLLSSPINTTRQLGVTLAISQGISIDELTKLCIDDKWFYDMDFVSNTGDLRLGCTLFSYKLHKSCLMAWAWGSDNWMTSGPQRKDGLSYGEMNREVSRRFNNILTKFCNDNNLI